MKKNGRAVIKKLLEDLRAANTKLVEANDNKSNFLSIASHQLRAPIGGVRSYLTMMCDGDFGRLSPKQKQILELNIDVLDHTLHIIGMFLDINRMESGKIELSRKPVDLGKLAEGVKKELALAAARQGISLRLKTAAGLPRVSADEEKIRNVIFNLVENAIKYTKSGTVDIVLRKMKNSVECRVTDSGIGISKKEISRLFTKFVRAGGGFKVSHGSGLGLYIIKTLVDIHGGKVFVESPGPGKGSSFGFRLPVRRIKAS